MQLPIQLDRTLPQPLQDQLFEQMRQLIITGKLKPKSRIIATRFLAEQVGVSRTTVLLVYEKLISEGYLRTQPTVGTFVCEGLPSIPTIKQTNKLTHEKSIIRQADIRPMAFDKVYVSPNDPKRYCIDFTRHYPDSSLLPLKLWMRCTQDVLGRYGSEVSDRIHPQGHPVLRQVLAEWLTITRGMIVMPDQIVIVTGMRQAYAILTHILQRREEKVVVESSGKNEIIHFLENRHASLVPVSIDQNGLISEQLPEKQLISFACVTPSRENVMGGAMPLHRRKQLIDWARKHGAYIIEDDVDRDLSYQGSPPSPIISMDNYGLVFHVGSFIKTLGAGHCLGYIIAPSEFIEPVCAIKSMSDDGCCWIEQRVLAEFIASGNYDHHLRRLRRTLLLRRDCLRGCLKTHLGASEIIGIESGSQLTWVLPPSFPEARTIRDIARQIDVDIMIMDKRPKDNFGSSTYDRLLIFSYAGLLEWQIKEGITRLARIIYESYPHLVPCPQVLQKSHMA